MKKNLLLMIAVLGTVAFTQTDVNAQESVNPATAQGPIVNTTRVNIILADIMGTTNPLTTPGTGADAVDAGDNKGTGPVVPAKDENGNDLPKPDPSAGATTHEVTFNYNGANRYMADQVQNVPGKINVISSRDFDINVRAASVTFSGPTGSAQSTGEDKPIPVSVLRIQGKAGATADYGQQVVLTAQDQVLIAGQKGGVNLPYDVRYTIPAAEAANFIKSKTGTYTVLVYYSMIGK